MDLFRKYQSLLLRFVNTTHGRKQLFVPKEYDRYSVIKLTPNSIHFNKGFGHYIAEFRTYPLYERILGLALADIDIVNRSKYKNVLTDEIKAFMHYLDSKVVSEYPQIYHASGDPIYSEAGDGDIYGYHATWATLRGAATGTVEGTQTAIRTRASLDVTPEYGIYRSYFPFITSGIGAGQQVDTATLSLYGLTVGGDAGGTIVLIQTSQAATGSLAAGDYDAITLNSPDEGASRFDIGSWATSAYNAFTLNATGKTWVDMEGNTLLGLRMSDDVDNTAPTGTDIDDVRCSSQAETGTTQDPKLVVEYSLAPSGGSDWPIMDGSTSFWGWRYS